MTWHVGSATIADDSMSKNNRQFVLDSGKTIQIRFGDITREHVDAIVNAANAYLQHGGGVAGVISLNGGPIIQEESDQWIENHGPVQHDSPAYTSGGKLSCMYVIHTVGPVWGEGDEDRKLAGAISGSLAMGDQLAISSIALPAISTGVFRFPLKRAAKIIIEEIRDYFSQHPESSLEQARIVLFDEKSLTIFTKFADSIFDNIVNPNQC